MIGIERTKGIKALDDFLLDCGDISEDERGDIMEQVYLVKEKKMKEVEFTIIGRAKVEAQEDLNSLYTDKIILSNGIAAESFETVDLREVKS